MDDMFQLSIELYDTKESKVVWSDRWEEDWNNLTTIKMSLSDGLLKALDISSKVIKRMEAANPIAYEFYLKAKYKFLKRETIDDLDMVRELLYKAIEYDNNLILAQILLGLTYSAIGDNKKAMSIYTPALQLAEDMNDKFSLGVSHARIGWIYWKTGKLNKALEHYEYSTKIMKVLGDKRGFATGISSIGDIYWVKGRLNKALGNYHQAEKIWTNLSDNYGIEHNYVGQGLIYFAKGEYDKTVHFNTLSLKINKEIGNKLGTGFNLNNIGKVYLLQGNLNNALEHIEKSFQISKEMGHKYLMSLSLSTYGMIYIDKGIYEKGINYLEQSISLQKEIELKVNDILIDATSKLYLIYKKTGKEYDENKIGSLIRKTPNIQYYIYYTIYQLLEDDSYLKTAFNQVQEKASAMEEEFSMKFLSYPIPKAIVEEWEKVK